MDQGNINQQDKNQQDIMNQRNIDNLYILCMSLGLGTVIGKPIEVKGGLLHSMFKITTHIGIFAVKCLNPAIMCRDNVLTNMINSERISEILALNIPTIPAKIISGKYVHRYKEQYYMIYDWLDGKSIFPPEIKEEHCIAIGDIIGKIHSINISLHGVSDEGDVSTIFQWRKLLEMANEIKAIWAIGYEQAIEDIILWNQKVLNAKAILSKEKVISHRDLDPKNVMWQGNRPFIIDWEAAGYVNPYQELLEIINYWADDGSGSLHKNRCLAILDSYKMHKDLKHVNWDMVLDSGYDGMLGWLEYNVNRALGIEVSCKEEITLGEQQVISTITELRRYQVKRKLLREWLSQECKDDDEVMDLSMVVSITSG